MGMELVMDVLLHFGFPKTGSSTLQFGLFKPLHDLGVINLRTWRQDDPNEHHDSRPSSRLFNHLELLDESIEFVEDKLNVLSDESFTAPTRLRINNYGDDIEDPFNFPLKLKEQIENKYKDVVFKCLMIVRNHPSLIYSQYVEEFNLKEYKNVDILFADDGNIDLSGYEIYNFYRYYSQLVDVFGKDNVNIMFFEQWSLGPNVYISQLSDLLGVDSEVVAEYLTKAHVNKKEKSSVGYYTKNKSHCIPFLTEDQKSSIRRYFMNDSIKLSKLLPGNMSLEKLGYIN